MASLSLALSLPFMMSACDRVVQPVGPDDERDPMASAWEDAHNLCVYGCPAGAPYSDCIIDRSVYVLSNNGHTKFADWVAYKVSEQTIGQTARRHWHEDPDLPGETLRPSDYRDVQETLKMERGHQAPVASLTGSLDAILADNLSNVTPQGKELNEGPWEYLEQAERNLALHQHVVVHTTTGPLYERDMPKLPYAHLDHVIPSGYWKVVAIVEEGRLKAAAFIMDQRMGRHERYCGAHVSLQIVQTRASLKLFPNLNESARRRIETGAGDLLPKLGCMP